MIAVYDDFQTQNFAVLYLNPERCTSIQPKYRELTEFPEIELAIHPLHVPFMLEVGKAACTRTLSQLHTDTRRRRESQLFVSRMEAIEQIKLKWRQCTFENGVDHGNPYPIFER